MPDGLVTNRRLQNQATGVDLQVPVYQEVRGPMMTGHVEYHIIVVTRLAAFKSSRHRPGDTVQLMVPKTYSEIDEFHSRLAAQYPHVALPAMPRKALFVGESDIRERRAAFDQLLRFIASHPALAACPVLLEFLGAKSTEEDGVRGRTVPLGEKTEEEEVNFFQSDAVPPPKRIPSPKPRRTFGEMQHKEEEDNDNDDDDEDEAYLGPLGNTKKKNTNKKPVQMPPVSPGQPKPRPRPANHESLFADKEDASEAQLFTFTGKEGDVKLFEDPDLGGTVGLGDSSLLLPTAYEETGGLSAGSGLDEDTEQLFRIEDDFAKLLQLTKRSRQDKPALAPKPTQRASPVVVPGGGGGSPGKPAVAVDQLKDQMDIFKYIQQQQSQSADDEDLFS